MAELGQFGWNQLLTCLGMLITISIAAFGFRTFGRWKREKIEERRIDLAFDALSIAYEVEGVFDSIRSPGAFGYEWKDMPHSEGETEADRKYKTTYYVPLKRLSDNHEFFQRVLKLQPRFMAAFGPETQSLFQSLNRARAHVQASAQMLMTRGSDEGIAARQRVRMEADIWSGMADVYNAEELPEGDRVKKQIDAFKDGVVAICRPVVDREFRLGFSTK